MLYVSIFVELLRSRPALAVWLAAPAGRQESLVETDPARFFRPPYVGHRGWVGVYLDVQNIDWDELADLVEDSYRLIAPKKLGRGLGSDWNG